MGQMTIWEIIKKYNEEHPPKRGSFNILRLRVRCADGKMNFEISAGLGACAEPETWQKDGCYESLEVYTGWPDELLGPYDAGYHFYHYVPVDVINQIIEKHGGIK